MITQAFLPGLFFVQVLEQKPDKGYVLGRRTKMFMDAWGFFTALVYLVYLVRFLIRGHKGKPFFYFDEFLGAGFVGVIFAMGYVCIKGLIG